MQDRFMTAIQVLEEEAAATRNAMREAQRNAIASGVVPDLTVLEQEWEEIGAALAWLRQGAEAAHRLLREPAPDGCVLREVPEPYLASLERALRGQA